MNAAARGHTNNVRGTVAARLRSGGTPHDPSPRIAQRTGVASHLCGGRPILYLRRINIKKQDELIAQAHALIVDDAALVWVVHDTNPHALSPKSRNRAGAALVSGPDDDRSGAEDRLHSHAHLPFRDARA